MRNPLRNLLTVLLCCAGCAPMTREAPPQASVSRERWAVYYDKALPASTFKGYDLVVFDRHHYPDFHELQKNDTVVLAYVSIGEVPDKMPEKDVLARENALLGTNAVWHTHIVDLASPEWHRAVLGQIDDARKKGFDGVMLDTVDSPLALSDASMGKSAEAQDDAVALIREIRQAHPDMKIMLNRGFVILPRVAPYLDYVLAESTLVQTDISTGQSRMFPPNNYQFAVSKLAAARDVAPWLKIYTLDYWNQDDIQGLHTIYAIHRAQGFSPYVSTPDLRRFTPEPVELTRHASGTLVRGDRDA